MNDFLKGEIVGSYMWPIGEFPLVGLDCQLKDCIDLMDSYRLGVACVSSDGKIVGVVTDGDLRRKLLAVQKPLSFLFSDDIEEHMTCNPAQCFESDLLIDAVKTMSEKSVSDLPVISRETGEIVGLLHLKSIVETILAGYEEKSSV